MGEEMRGEWWVPEESDRRTRGTLSVDAENGVELTLEGTLQADAPLGGLAGPAETHPIVLGDTLDGKITLTDARGWGLGLALPGVFGTAAYSARAALIGAHFDAAAVRAVRRIAVEFSGLIDWLEVPGIPTEMEHGDPGTRVIRATAQRQMDLAVAIPGAELTFRVDPTVKVSRSSVTMHQNAQLLLDVDEPDELWTQFRQWVIPMRDLLSLATARPVRIEGLWIPDGEEWARFVAPLRQADRSITDPPIVQSDVLLRFSDIADRLGEAIGAWYALHRELRPAIDAISAVDRAPFVFAETRFSNYVGAAERIHAILIGGTPATTEAHRERVRRILDVCPPDLREWAKPVLEDANKKSLRRRIDELVESAGRVASHGLAPDRDWFVREVNALRNKVAHGTGPGVDGRTLYWFSRALLWLIRTRLLRDLGIPQPVIEERVFHAMNMEGVADELARIRRGED